VKRAGIIIGAIVLISGVVAAKLLRHPFLNTTSRISWVDTTENPADVIEAIQFAVTRQDGDPRTQDESCIERLLLVPAGEKVNLGPLLSGLPVGSYLVYPRAVSADGTRQGPWGNPQIVVVDLKKPGSPKGLGRK
jgi:hypothetical protein